MRFYREEIPSLRDTVMVSIKEIDTRNNIVTVKIIDYGDKEGLIPFNRIHRREKRVKNFLKTNETKIFPCSIYKEGSIPILSPSSNPEEKRYAMTLYNCLMRIERLADDFLFVNEDIDEELIQEKFMWPISDAFRDEEEVTGDSFSNFLSDLDSLFALSELDEDMVSLLKKQIEPRVIIGDTVVSGVISILVISSHSQVGLNRLLDELVDRVTNLTYQETPLYSFTVSESSEEKCRELIASLKPLLEAKAEEFGIKAVIKYNPRDTFVNSRTIRLAPLNKTGETKDKGDKQDSPDTD